MTAMLLSTVAAVVARALLVPTALRTFSVDSRAAADVYGVGPHLLSELLDLGLPAVIDGGTVRLDPGDLANVALHLGLPSMQRRAMVAWRQTLEHASRQPTARYSTRYDAVCPSPGHTGRCTFTFLIPPGRFVRRLGEGSRSVRVCRPTRWAPLPPEARAAAAALGDLHFFIVPPVLRADVKFARATRLAGCGMAAQLFADDCLTLEIPARRRFGLLLSVPFSTPHNWVEIEVDGEWTPFDPHLIQTMVRHAGLDEHQWPVSRSPGAILAPLGTARAELACHHDDPVPVSILTRCS